MANSSKTKIVFLWHMHQPDYRDIVTGEYYFPWTYLHAIKDYVDMVAHLERQPHAKAVVNFAPILLEQIDDYAQQIKNCLHDHGEIKDKILASLVEPVLPSPGSTAFLDLASKFLRANRSRMIERFPVYRELADTLESLHQKPFLAQYLNHQFLIDLGVWYHLSWLAETLRREDHRVQQLQEKARHFSMSDRRLLLTIIGELMSSIVPRYKHLAEKKQIELCMSPYAHPIVPLLIDINSAKEAMPDVALPEIQHYPDGINRSIWHLQHGKKVFQEHFGITPVGCWASEGSLSDATLKLLQENGFIWTATGDSVLHNSLYDPANKESNEWLAAGKNLYRNYHFANIPLNVFFRDDGLSDLIGFKYASWHADDAVGDLVNHITAISNNANDNNNTVISIIMDGENAWEYFPENAYYFLEQLYRRINENSRLELSTYSEILRDQKPEPLLLKHLVAGSWVYGTFSTWIGDKDKNRAWDMLCKAKQDADKALQENKFSADEKSQIEKQMALCEGSDWFWWFGDYNPSQSVKDFDYLYRRHLANLYRLIDTPAPDYLQQVISEGGSSNPATGGVMRQGHA